MSTTNRQPVNYTVYTCARCPNGRAYDMLQLTKSGKNAQRCLQYHVQEVHKDFQGDFKDLIGQTIVRQRKQGRTTRQKIEKDVETKSSTQPRSAFDPARSPSPEPAGQGLKLYEDSSIATTAVNHARQKISVILQKFENDDNEERVTVGTDAWDRAAVNGELGEEMQQMAVLAFPNEMFDSQFTVCATSDGFVLQHMLEYYSEKIARLQSGADDEDN